MLKQGVQDEIKNIGDYGCYALTLCRIAEMSAVIEDRNYANASTAVRDVVKAIEKGWIKPDMTVLNGAAFLDSLTARKWFMDWRPASYEPKEGDYLAAEWFNKRTGLTHFTLEHPVKWNSLSNSVTVKEGAIRSYRVYRAGK